MQSPLTQALEILPRLRFGKTHYVLELQDLLEFSAFKLSEGTASLALEYFTHPAYRCSRWTKKGHIVRIAAVRGKIHNFFVGEGHNYTVAQHRSGGLYGTTG